jgi:hypothetical protein
MMADSKLKVIEQFGYRNKDLNNFKTPGRPGLPVPTSLLVDNHLLQVSSVSQGRGIKLAHGFWIGRFMHSVS